MKVINFLKNFKNFYHASPENRTGVHLFLGFVVIPVVGMSILYFIMYNLYL